MNHCKQYEKTPLVPKYANEHNYNKKKRRKATGGEYLLVPGHTLCTFPVKMQNQYQNN
jgi:hypothetical protein